jgi:SAM-dependent methyltransferase
VIQPDLCAAGSENDASYARRLRYVADLINLAPTDGPLRALDFGSGIGVTSRFMRAAGIDVQGLDPSASRAKHSSSMGTSTLTHLDQLAAAAPFNLLVFDNVLEHLPDPVETLERVAARCSRGTIAFVSVPDCGERALARVGQSLRLHRVLDKTFNPWEHLNYFSLAHLDTLMDRGGFVRISEAHLPGPVEIGLRPTAARVGRLKNVAASTARLLRYALSGRGVESPERTFYRKA